jgi:anti-sigma regulatory factor (Ser/Thr protein kinase)
MFVYGADSAFERLVAPFLEEGLAEGQAVIAAFVPEKQTLLRDALGPAAEQITFNDAREVYTRPETVLARYDGVIRGLLRDGARSIRVIGELPLRTAQDDPGGWALYEGLLNHAFSHAPIRIGCVYDERIVPASLLQAARRAHPRMHHGDWIGGAWEDCSDFDPAGVVRSATPPAQPVGELQEIAVEGGASALRRRLAEAMASADVPAEQAANLLVAAGEAAANARQHGNGLRALRAGRVDGRFVCEVTDGGPGFDDPLAGHLPPRSDARAGAGLWVARQLTSRLEFLATPGGGTTARLWV